MSTTGSRIDGARAEVRITQHLEHSCRPDGDDRLFEVGSPLGDGDVEVGLQLGCDPVVLLRRPLVRVCILGRRLRRGFQFRATARIAFVGGLGLQTSGLPAQALRGIGVLGLGSSGLRDLSDQLAPQRAVQEQILEPGELLVDQRVRNPRQRVFLGPRGIGVITAIGRHTAIGIQRSEQGMPRCRDVVGPGRDGVGVRVSVDLRHSLAHCRDLGILVRDEL